MSWCGVEHVPHSWPSDQRLNESSFNELASLHPILDKPNQSPSNGHLILDDQH